MNPCPKAPPSKRRVSKHTRRAKTRKKRGMVIDLDKVARREIVEDRDQDRCQRCTAESGHYFGITGDMSRDKVVIQWAHVHTREYYITRWEPDNSLALCSRCHVWFDNHKVLSLDWFAKKFPERWERIKRMLQGNCKTTDADIRAMWKERCAGGGSATMTTELYKLYSHFNFSPEQWREAAQRYLALEDAMQRLETEDAEVDHDALGENFERCDICEQISELQDDRKEFATEFGSIWAKQAISDRQEPQK